jgi:ribosomal protein S18 acetylase RimI-like enzyme
MKASYHRPTGGDSSRGEAPPRGGNNDGYRSAAMPSEPDIRILADPEPHLAALAAILADAVAGGASVSFMAPFGEADARAFWQRLVPLVASGETLLLGGFVDGRLLGTVQLALATPPNQPHRGEIRKLLVHRAARRRGLASALMRAAEAEAARRCRTLLTLDTVAGSPAERLYVALGYAVVGVIPDYALWPDGPFCDAAILYKRLAGHRGAAM